eukprot:28412-Hanusia_phi.AAC.8
MARKVALITGITGQDGSYLAELLLSKICVSLKDQDEDKNEEFGHGYEVHGIKRRASSFNQVQEDARIEHIYEKSQSKEEKVPFYTHYGDVTDLNNLTSFELPVYTAHVDGIGTLNALEAIRQAGLNFGTLRKDPRAEAGYHHCLYAVPLKFVSRVKPHPFTLALRTPVRSSWLTGAWSTTEKY